ncbi:MAG: hypothetical protein HY831_04335 [Candidatus Aenigmarchaeota archaeon]|nr:hypothetical protein [Candidatus Aenigmarchaeota archaeon]
MNDRIDTQYIPFRFEGGRAVPIYVTSNKLLAEGSIRERVADGYYIAAGVVYGSEDGHIPMYSDRDNIPIDKLKWHEVCEDVHAVSRTIKSLKGAGLNTTLDVQYTFEQASKSGRRMNISGYGEKCYRITQQVFTHHQIPLVELHKRLL